MKSHLASSQRPAPTQEMGVVSAETDLPQNTREGISKERFNWLVLQVVKNKLKSSAEEREEFDDSKGFALNLDMGSGMKVWCFGVTFRRRKLKHHTHLEIRNQFAWLPITAQNPLCIGNSARWWTTRGYNCPSETVNNTGHHLLPAVVMTNRSALTARNMLSWERTHESLKMTLAGPGMYISTLSLGNHDNN